MILLATIPVAFILPIVVFSSGNSPDPAIGIACAIIFVPLSLVALYFGYKRNGFFAFNGERIIRRIPVIKTK